MKFAILILLTVVSAYGEQGPLLVSADRATNKVMLCWTHPNAHRFLVRQMVNGVTNIETEVFYARAKREGTMPEFKRECLVAPGTTNVFDVVKVTELDGSFSTNLVRLANGTQHKRITVNSKKEYSDWSNKLIVIVPSKPTASLAYPPDPFDKTRHSMRSAAMPAETLTPTLLSGLAYALTWDYTGPIAPNYWQMIYRSTDLRMWESLTNVLAARTNWCPVAELPMAFYKVVTLNSNDNSLLYGLTTNLVMDP